MAVELYADQNSMIKVGKIIGDRIHSNYSLYYQSAKYVIPRQTIQKMLLKHRKVKFKSEKLKATPETIYIMADEKYIPLHNKLNEELSGKKSTVKVAVIFEKIEAELDKYGKPLNSKKLINKSVVTKCEANIWPSVLDRLNELYDIDKIKKIYILCGGAIWIKLAN